MTENKGKKFTDGEQAEELSLEDCGQVAGGWGPGHNTKSNEMFSDVFNNSSLRGSL